MNSTELIDRLNNAQGEAPSDLSAELKVLWLAKAGNWHGAHDIAQDLPDPNGAWLHAHLHRQEGDLGNASYWYHRANQVTPSSDLSIEDEWRKLVSAFAK
ncbi:hypothetical protein [Roseibacillus persicicus]|uniref:Uncharacterized protein n=1 Tax=Roseibacillus persicicus TaxID=454148 RepID=A0A918TXF2_9BACT|nr:hypothetical protein [Roseibacillus persicicus]MDQ8188709.1 hypothetical protein [Roseibacillus persicicus]GHC63269.1 hypothetical protein GCM10007100_33520 [Roseibacillus persicicus]